jgi:putative mRNA 3-end processing factor
MVLTLTPAGLYCPAGDFYIDPWLPVGRAAITHAHADHLRWGHGRYLVAAPGLAVTRARLHPDAAIDTLPYDDKLNINNVLLSFHPAGHVLGSAQIRIEVNGEVWVVSGDYKTGGGDPTCTPFEPVRCHGFVTESTFGLPVYRWKADSELFEEINSWWRDSAAAGKCCLLLGYSLGKAQRLLAGLDPAIGPIYLHGAVERMTAAYRQSGVLLPPTQYAGVYEETSTSRTKRSWAGAMVIAPPSVLGSPRIKKFAPYSTATASGWMTVRGTRRRQAVDRGFVVSDHADWPGLLGAIEATRAETIWVTHGYTAVLARYLAEKGLRAEQLRTRFEGEAGGAIEPESNQQP